MIHLLEAAPNERGDLFGRLVQDLFHALGYHDFRLNIPKSGRELDLRGDHRTEKRRAFAECKATSSPVGGADINKFVGALDAERRSSGTVPLTGYFVSLSGFTSSALEQEEAFEEPRVILIDSSQLIRELVLGRILVSPEVAAEAAGRCLTDSAHELSMTGPPEVLAWDGGWVWLVKYGKAGDVEGYVLIHADGEPLAVRSRADLRTADEPFRRLSQLNDLNDSGATDAAAAAPQASARSAYLAYLEREYGEITVDGLPADHEVGGQRITLEQLYVPLHLRPAAPADLVLKLAPLDGPDSDVEEFEPGDELAWLASDVVQEDGLNDRFGVGKVLSERRQIAVLGPPGSGKSTLLKRLAVAYAVPDRRGLVTDDLPDADWLPIVIRCRQLGDDARRPVSELLRLLPERAEMPDHHEALVRLIDASLKDGTALLLIDGLDEIADDSTRLSFVKQLRTFIGTYPTVRLVVTSRETGFRTVAGAISDVCSQFGLAPLDRDDIERLTLAWHRIAVGESQTLESDAAAVAASIYERDRVRQLAVNPLLLTTLLLVRRWIGELPRKRTALYGKAIEVLLMTWNVEGHEPLDLDEALPQLAYVAFAMTVSKRQVLSGREMEEILLEARVELPEILGYVKTSPSHFIKRVEERSSLLSLSGHAEVDGQVTPIYEFKHLTFQEYLTAVASVEGYYRNTTHGPTIVDVLGPRLEDNEWREVISIALVLAGRRAASLVSSLCEVLESAPTSQRSAFDSSSAASSAILATGLADEALLAPPLVTRASLALATTNDWTVLAPRALSEILSSRYGAIFTEAVRERYETGGSGFSLAGSVHSEIIALEHELSTRDVDAWQAFVDKIERLLGSDDERHLKEGSLLLMRLAFGHRHESTLEPPHWREQLAHMATLNLRALVSEDAPTAYAAAWAFVWLGEIAAIDEDVAHRAAPRLLELWSRNDSSEVSSVAAWATSRLPVLSVLVNPFAADHDWLPGFLIGEWESEPRGPYRREDRRPAALLASFWIGKPWSTDDLVTMARELNGDTTARRLREALGDPSDEDLSAEDE